MSGTSKTIVSICVLLLASLVLYYGMTPPQESKAQATDVPLRPTMFGGDAEEKLAQLGFPPIAVGLVEKSSPAPAIPESNIFAPEIGSEPINSEIGSEPINFAPEIGSEPIKIEEVKPEPVKLKETIVTTYTVRVGETLGEIASRELGSFKMWRDIASLNGIDDPASIMPGRTLRMPKQKQTQIVVKQESVVTASGKRTHKVTEGETFSSIADDYYDDPNKYLKIVQANPSVDPTRLQIGTMLVIPTH